MNYDPSVKAFALQVNADAHLVSLHVLVRVAAELSVVCCIVTARCTRIYLSCDYM